MGFKDSNGADLVVEYSTDDSIPWNDVGHTWNNINAEAGTLDPSGGDRSTEAFFTFAGASVGLSDTGVIQIAMNVVFLNAATSFLEYITDTWDGTVTKTFYLRWTYNNGASGALRRTALVACLTNPFTGGDASSGAPVTKSLTFAVDGVIHRDAVP